MNFNIGTGYFSREKCILQRLYVPGLDLEPGNGLAYQREVVLRFNAHLFREFGALITMMDGFDHLFKADGDEEADDDGGDVDEEVAPGGGGVVGGVDVEHGGWLLTAGMKGLLIGWGLVEVAFQDSIGLFEEHTQTDDLPLGLRGDLEKLIAVLRRQPIKGGCSLGDGLCGICAG